MSDKPISDLRRRIIADMTIRSFSDKTQRDYIRQIEAFASFLGRSPDTATGDDIRRFQFAQVEQGAQPPKMNGQVSALRFFFTITLGRADLAHQLARTHYPRRLPRVLPPDQIGRLIEAAPGPGLKHKAALSVAYGAGLRGCEIVMLRVGDIDSQRMLIRVEMGTRAVTKETTHVTNTIEPDTVEFAKNSVVRDLILPAVEKMQRPGETLADAAWRWQHDAQDAPLLMKAAGFEAVDKARPVNALRIDQTPRQVGGADATAVNDPAAADAARKELIEQAMQIRPWMTVTQAAVYVEQMRQAAQRAVGGHSPTGSSPGRL